MSDTAAAELPADVQEKLEEIVETTRKGFDLKARLQNRGLRKATITLYLDEEVGPQLGWAFDARDNLGTPLGRVRAGVVGDIDELEEQKRNSVAEQLAEFAKDQTLGTDPKSMPKVDTKTIDKKIAEAEKRRAELLEKLSNTGLTIKLRAVPPIIQKDARRRAKATLGITEKNIPDDRIADFVESETAHLMTMIFESITDNETGITNTETTYEDAIDLAGFLPAGQYTRLADKLSEVQFTDAISRSIEGQEDFS